MTQRVNHPSDLLRLPAGTLLVTCLAVGVFAGKVLDTYHILGLGDPVVLLGKTSQQNLEVWRSNAPSASLLTRHGISVLDVWYATFAFEVVT